MILRSIAVAPFGAPPLPALESRLLSQYPGSRMTGFAHLDPAFNPGLSAHSARASITMWNGVLAATRK